jgi:hypothetical protein
MNLNRTVLKLGGLLLICFAYVAAQSSGSQPKHFDKDGLSFDYPSGWMLQDDTNSDAQQLSLARADSDVQIRVFVHKGRISPDKMGDAPKALIDTYIDSTAKQFIASGARPEQSPDATEIGGTKADGVVIKAVLGGEPGAARIYWALVGRRVVVLTFLGPDKQLQQQATAWDQIRNSLMIAEPKAKASPTPK